MKEIISNFIKQFDFEPFIENKNNLELNFKKYLIVGMGGSNLATDFFKFVFSDEDILIHRDYSLPNLKDLNERIIIAISVSGETEETIDVLKESLDQNLRSIVISQDGKLLKMSQEKSLPYIQLPQDKTPPRLSLGYIFKAILSIVKPSFLLKSDYFKGKINIEDLENKAQVLAKEIGNKNFLIYSDNVSFPLAYYWKISFNENAKKASFYNLLPELCHNEIEMFEDENIYKNFYVFFVINTKFIHPQNFERVKVIKKILDNLKVNNSIIQFDDNDKLVIVIKNIILASFASYFNALERGFDPLEINLIKEIKRLL